MGNSQQTFNKKEREKKRLKKREEKAQKREQRKANSPGGQLDDMMAYVDENGMIVDTPPDPLLKKEVKLENIEIGVPKREKEKLDTVRHGKVEFFDTTKGFGFIKEDETQEKYVKSKVNRFRIAGSSIIFVLQAKL